MEAIMHKSKRRKRKCYRTKCTLRVPLLGICLSSKKVKKKCPAKRRRHARR